MAIRATFRTKSVPSDGTAARLVLWATFRQYLEGIDGLHAKARSLSAADLAKLPHRSALLLWFASVTAVKLFNRFKAFLDQAENCVRLAQTKVRFRALRTQCSKLILSKLSGKRPVNPCSDLEAGIGTYLRPVNNNKPLHLLPPIHSSNWQLPLVDH